MWESGSSLLQPPCPPTTSDQHLLTNEDGAGHPTDPSTLGRAVLMGDKAGEHEHGRERPPPWENGRTVDGAGTGCRVRCGQLWSSIPNPQRFLPFLMPKHGAQPPPPEHPLPSCWSKPPPTPGPPAWGRAYAGSLSLVVPGAHKTRRRSSKSAFMRPSHP